jgi:hypothetical protein
LELLDPSRPSGGPESWARQELEDAKDRVGMEARGVVRIGEIQTRSARECAPRCCLEIRVVIGDDPP